MTGLHIQLRGFLLSLRPTALLKLYLRKSFIYLYIFKNLFVVFGPLEERLQLTGLSSGCPIIIVVLWKICFGSFCSSFTPFHLYMPPPICANRTFCDFINHFLKNSVPLSLSIMHLRFGVNFGIQCFLPVNWKRAGWDWGLLPCP